MLLNVIGTKAASGKDFDMYTNDELSAAYPPSPICTKRESSLNL